MNKEKGLPCNGERDGRKWLRIWLESGCLATTTLREACICFLLVWLLSLFFFLLWVAYKGGMHGNWRLQCTLTRSSNDALARSSTTQGKLGAYGIRFFFHSFGLGFLAVKSTSGCIIAGKFMDVLSKTFQDFIKSEIS